MTTKERRFRLKLPIAKRLEHDHAKHSPAFAHLIGQVGTLTEMPSSKYRYGRGSHYLHLRGGIRIAVTISEVEQVEDVS